MAGFLFLVFLFVGLACIASGSFLLLSLGFGLLVWAVFALAVAVDA